MQQTLPSACHQWCQLCYLPETHLLLTGSDKTCQRVPGYLRRIHLYAVVQRKDVSSEDTSLRCTTVVRVSCINVSATRAAQWSMHATLFTKEIEGSRLNEFTLLMVRSRESRLPSTPTASLCSICSLYILLAGKSKKNLLWETGLSAIVTWVSNCFADRALLL